MSNTEDLGPEDMEDLKGELVSFKEDVLKLFHSAMDRVDKVMATSGKTVKENHKLTIQMVGESIKEVHVSLKGVADQVANLQEKISKFDSFKTHTVNHQVSTKSECQKLKKEHDEMNRGFNKNTEVVDDLKNQLIEIRKKLLNEQQLTQDLTVKVEEMSGHFSSLEDKVNQLQSDICNMRKTQLSPPLQPSTGPHEIGPMSEGMLRQRKQSNIIIFGLPELNDGDTDLLDQLGSLWNDIGVSDLDNGSWSGFRVGKYEDGRKRPVIVKFLDIAKKFEILLNAKNLKGKAKWAGVAIAHDLTKLQCLQEKERELHLRLEAEKRNASCPDIGGRSWRVVGVRGSRRVALVHGNAMLMASV